MDDRRHNPIVPSFEDYKEDEIQGLTPRRTLSTSRHKPVKSFKDMIKVNERAAEDAERESSKLGESFMAGISRIGGVSNITDSYMPSTEASRKLIEVKKEKVKNYWGITSDSWDWLAELIAKDQLAWDRFGYDPYGYEVMKGMSDGQIAVNELTGSYMVNDQPNANEGDYDPEGFAGIKIREALSTIPTKDPKILELRQLAKDNEDVRELLEAVASKGNNQNDTRTLRYLRDEGESRVRDLHKKSNILTDIGIGLAAGTGEVAGDPADLAALGVAGVGAPFKIGAKTVMSKEGLYDIARIAAAEMAIFSPVVMQREYEANRLIEMGETQDTANALFEERGMEQMLLGGIAALGTAGRIALQDVKIPNPFKRKPDTETTPTPPPDKTIPEKANQTADELQEDALQETSNVQASQSTIDEVNADIDKGNTEPFRPTRTIGGEEDVRFAQETGSEQFVLNDLQREASDLADEQARLKVTNKKEKDAVKKQLKELEEQEKTELRKLKTEYERVKGQAGDGEYRQRYEDKRNELAKKRTEILANQNRATAIEQRLVENKIATKNIKEVIEKKRNLTDEQVEALYANKIEGLRSSLLPEDTPIVQDAKTVTNYEQAILNNKKEINNIESEVKKAEDELSETIQLARTNAARSNEVINEVFDSPGDNVAVAEELQELRSQAKLLQDRYIQQRGHIGFLNSQIDTLKEVNKRVALERDEFKIINKIKQAEIKESTAVNKLISSMLNKIEQAKKKFKGAQTDTDIIYNKFSNKLDDITERYRTKIKHNPEAKARIDDETVDALEKLLRDTNTQLDSFIKRKPDMKDKLETTVNDKLERTSSMIDRAINSVRGVAEAAEKGFGAVKSGGKLVDKIIPKKMKKPKEAATKDAPAEKKEPIINPKPTKEPADDTKFWDEFFDHKDTKKFKKEHNNGDLTTLEVRRVQSRVVETDEGAEEIPITHIRVMRTLLPQNAMARNIPNVSVETKELDVSGGVFLTDDGAVSIIGFAENAEGKMLEERLSIGWKDGLYVMGGRQEPKIVEMREGETLQQFTDRRLFKDDADPESGRIYKDDVIGGAIFGDSLTRVLDQMPRIKDANVNEVRDRVAKAVTCTVGKSK